MPWLQRVAGWCEAMLGSTGKSPCSDLPNPLWAISGYGWLRYQLVSSDLPTTSGHLRWQ